MTGEEGQECDPRACEQNITSTNKRHVNVVKLPSLLIPKWFPVCI